MAETEGHQDGDRDQGPPERPVRVPGPRRRRTPLRRVVGSLIVTVLVIAGGIGAALLWGIEAARTPGPLAEPKTVIVERGSRTAEIAESLERQGVIADATLFVAVAHLTRARGGSLKAGEYEFPAGVSLNQVLALLRSGRSVVHKLTVPEGWTTSQVIERVNEHPALAGTVDVVPGEGTLLPDTYLFERGLARTALVERMSEAQEKLIDELWEKRAPGLPIRSKEEAVILASIVEKETSLPEERPLVAAVFINRLRKKMRLQSDPTIIYGIVGGAGRLDRPIRRSDITARTDYNTYQIDGLPPTPIANPGRDSLAAVLQPIDSDYLYFVADGSGGHVFARTLAEHRQNVQRWRQIEQTAREGAADDEAGADLAEETAVEIEPAEEAPDPEPALAAAAVAVPDTSVGPDASESATAPAQPEAAPAALEAAEAPAPVAAPDAQGGSAHEAVASEHADEPAPVPQQIPGTQDEPAAEASPETAPSPPAQVAKPRPKPPQPGSVTRLANRLVPIPRPKPRRD